MQQVRGAAGIRGATWIYTIYAAIAIGGGCAWRPPAVSGALLLAAFVQGIVFRYADWLARAAMGGRVAAFATTAAAGTMLARGQQRPLTRVSDAPQWVGGC
jgi:hypothetical protein